MIRTKLSPEFGQMLSKKRRTAPPFRQRPDNATPEELLEYLVDKWINYYSLLWDIPSKQVLLLTQKEISDLFVQHPILRMEAEMDRHTWYVLSYCEYKFQYKVPHKVRTNWLQIKGQIETFDFGMPKF